MRIERTQPRYGSELILPVGRAQRVVLCVCGGGHRRGFECVGRCETPLGRSSFVTFVCAVCAWFASCVCEGLHRGAGFEWRRLPHVFFTETGGSGAYAEE